MPMVRFCELTDVDTGERRTIESIALVEEFLGRKAGYVRKRINKNEIISDAAEDHHYKIKALKPVSMPFKPLIFERSMQLCWGCAKACGGCSWSRDFKPVKGWTARETVLKTQSTIQEIKSYSISACPEFVEG